MFIAPGKRAKATETPTQPTESETSHHSTAHTEAQGKTGSVDETASTQQKKPQPKKYYRRRSKRRRHAKRKLDTEMAPEEDAAEEIGKEAEDEAMEAEDEAKEIANDTKEEEHETNGKHADKNEENGHLGHDFDEIQVKGLSKNINVEGGGETLPQGSDDEVLENGEVHLSMMDSVSVSSEVNHVDDDDEVALLYEVDETFDSRKECDGPTESYHRRSPCADPKTETNAQKMKGTEGVEVQLPNGVCLPSQLNAKLSTKDQQETENEEHGKQRFM